MHRLSKKGYRYAQGQTLTWSCEGTGRKGTSWPMIQNGISSPCKKSHCQDDFKSGVFYGTSNGAHFV
jgi:hypothetical protein